MSIIESIKKIGSNFIITFRFYADVIKAVKKEKRILKSLQKQPMPNVISKKQTHTVITSIRENKYSVYNVLLKNDQSYPTRVIVQAYKMNTWENKIIDGKMLPVIIKDRFIELSPNNIYDLIDGLRNAGYTYFKSEGKNKVI